MHAVLHEKNRENSNGLINNKNASDIDDVQSKVLFHAMSLPNVIADDGTFLIAKVWLPDQTNHPT